MALVPNGWPGLAFRFLVAGGASTLVQYGVLYMGTEWFGIKYLLSGVIAHVLHVIVKFVLQKYWTFQSPERSRLPGQLWKYIAMEVANLGINTGLMFLLTEKLHLWYLQSQVIVTVLLSIESFIISYLIFRKPQPLQ